MKMIFLVISLLLSLSTIGQQYHSHSERQRREYHHRGSNTRNQYKQNSSRHHYRPARQVPRNGNIRKSNQINRNVRIQQERARQELQRKAQQERQMRAAQIRAQENVRRAIERKQREAVNRYNKEKLAREREAKKYATEQRRRVEEQRRVQNKLSMGAVQNNSSERVSNKKKEGLGFWGWMKLIIPLMIIGLIFGGASNSNSSTSSASSNDDNSPSINTGWQGSSSSNSSGESYWEERRRKEQEERQKEKEYKKVYEDEDRTEYVGKGGNPDTIEKQTPGDYALFDRQFDGTYKERWGDRVLDPDDK